MGKQWKQCQTHLKKPWCWEGLGAGREVDDRGWDGWMASPTRWARVWVNSWSWWWTGRPGELRFMGLQRVGHDWVNWLTELIYIYIIYIVIPVSHCYTAETVVESGFPKQTFEDSQDSGVPLLHQRVQGESVPNKEPWCFWGPVLYPLLCDWLHVSNLFVVYDWVLQVGARRTIKVKRGEHWLYITGGMSPWLM